MARVADTFTRADSSTSLGSADSGQAWSALVGTWGIASQKARCVSAVNDDMVVVDCGQSDMVVSAVITLGTGNDNPGLVARVSNSNNLYLASMNVAGNLALFKKVAGVYTSLGTAAAAIISGDIVSLSVRGSHQIVKVNGVDRIVANDTALSAGTKGGLRFGNGGAAPGNSRWDNFAIAIGVTFGMHRRTATEIDLYLEGVITETLGHPAETGAYVAMAATSTSALEVSVDRLEVRTAPAGTLLIGDDFSSLAAWTAGWQPSNPWTVSPTGWADTNSGAGTLGALIYQAQPAGGDFIEAQGVFFEGTVSSDGWLMLMLQRDTPAAAPDTVLPVNGYRVLLRAPGAPNEGGVELVNGRPLGGWAVGQIRMGA